MKQLHPNAVIIFYINGLLISFFSLGLLLFFPGALLVDLAIEGTLSFIWSISFFVLSIVIVFTVPLIWAQLFFKSFRYEMGNEAIVIEKGVVWKKHISIPYQRVQNIDIIRGPLARMIGLSDLQIQTAGISGVAVVEGRIPAIAPEQALMLKDQILSKVTKSKNQGL